MNVAEITSGYAYSYESDYYSVYLTAGTVYTVDMRGSSSNAGSLYDPYVYVYDSNGNYISADDNSGNGLDAKMTFFATISGYYQVYAYGHNYSGSYELSVSPTANTLFGDSYDNGLSGTTGDDTIYGRYGNDTIYGLGGNDYLLGDDGNDIIEPGFGNDTVYGGYGIDKVSYYNDAGTAGLVIDLRTDTAIRGSETDRLYDVESVDGGRGNDTIDGDDGANYLSGADGNDVVRAWGGNDELRGGIGDDVLEPGSGYDYVYGGPGTDKVSYYNETGTAGVTIDLTAGTAVRSGETDYLYDIENADGTRNADTIYGSAAVNVLSGADGNDVLYGRAGNDTLLGSGGNDRLLGEAGKDVLTGGAGVDMFDFDRTGDSAWTSGKTACDRITDFAHLTDKIDLSTIDAKSATAVNDTFTFLAAKGAAITAVGQVHWYQAGGNTYIEANTGGSTAPEIQIQLDGLKTITAADFVL